MKQNINKVYILLAVLLLSISQGFFLNSINSFFTSNSSLYLRIQDFFTFYSGIVVESLPFILLGVIISALFGVFITPDKLVSLIPKNKFLGHILLSMLGILMPVCECGNIPVARSLMMKKMSIPHVVTFLLAAPIINPITLFSTFEAFNFDRSYVVIRLVSALFISITFGLLISLFKDQNKLLEQKFYQEVCDHDHSHNKNRLEEFFNIILREFWSITKMMLLGALLASIFQVFVPRDAITQIGSHGTISVLVMILLAFSISICSNVDAFFALSFEGVFSKGSIISFLVFGPMIDIKILTMLRSTFSSKLLVLMSVYVFLVSFIIGTLVNYLM